MRGQGTETEAILYGEHQRRAGSGLRIALPRVEHLRNILPYSINLKPDAASAAMDTVSSAFGIGAYLRWDSYAKDLGFWGNTFICLEFDDQLFEVPYDHPLVPPLRDGLGDFPRQIVPEELTPLAPKRLADCATSFRNIYVPD